MAVVNIGLVFAALAAVLALSLQASRADGQTIKLAAPGYAGSETIIDLNAPFAEVEAAIADPGATGDIAVLVPVTPFTALTLTNATISAADDTVIINGEGTVFGTVGVEVYVVAQWGDPASSEPSFSLGVKVLDLAQFSLAALNSNWDLPTGDIELTNAYITYATDAQTLPDDQPFYLSNEIPQGVSFAGAATLASIIGDDAADGVGLADAEVGIAGSFNADASIFTSGSVANKELHLEAFIDIGDVEAINGWIAPTGTWTLSLDVASGAEGTSIEVGLSGQVLIDDGGDLGLPTTALDLSAAFSYDGGEVAVTMTIGVSDWANPFTLQGVTVKEGELQLGFAHSAEGVTVSVGVSGVLEIGDPAKEISISAFIEKTPDGFSAEFVGDLNTAVSVAEVVAFLAGPGGQDFLNSEAEAVLDALVLQDLHLRLGVEKNAEGAAFSLGFTAGVTYQGIGADFLVVVDKDASGTQFVLGISPRGEGGEPLTLGDLDSSLVAPISDIELPDVVLLLSNQPITGGEDDVAPEVFEFISPIYGCSDDCDFDLVAGASILASIPLPAALAGVTDSLWISSEDPIVLGGSFPLFGQVQPINLFAELPPMSPSCTSEDEAERAPEWFVQGQLSLRLRIDPAAESVAFWLEGELQTRIRKTDDIPTEQTECGTEKNDQGFYDYLTFDVSAFLSLSPEGVELTLAGGLTTDEPWEDAFGVEWLTVKQLRLELTLGVSPAGVTIGMGFRGAVVIGDKDIDTSIAIELTITAAPPWVVPNLIGFRFASRAGLEMQDIADFAELVTGEEIDLASAGLPNLAVKRLEFSFSQQNRPGLCLPLGIIIAGDLYIDPTDGYVPPEFTTCDAIPGADAPEGGDEALLVSAAATGGATPCSTEEEVEAGCFAGIRLEISPTGIFASAAMGAFELGPLTFDDALLELVLNSSSQSLTIKGGITVESVGQGSVAVSLRSDGIDFAGDINLYDVFWAHLEGHASFNLASPSFQVSGFMKQDLGRQINEQLVGIYEDIGATITIINGVIDTLQDPTKTLDDAGQKILSAPSDLEAMGYDVPDWLTWLTTEINSAIDTYEANNAGDGPLTTIINGVLQGTTITITTGEPSYYTNRECIGTWVGGSCYTTPPVPPSSYQVCIIACFWVDVPGIPGIPGLIVEPFCVGIELSSGCWIVPPITLDLPGLCDVAGLFGANPLAPYSCDATGLKNAVVDLFEDAFYLVFQEEFDDVQAEVQKVADAMESPAAVTIFDIPCLAFDMSFGSLQDSKNAFLFGAHLVIFNQDFYLNDVGWDFSKDVVTNAANLQSSLLAFILGISQGGSATSLCGEGSGAVNDTGVTAPSNLVLTAPSSVTEGGQITLSGTYSDPDAIASDTVGVTITWGDGSTQVVTPSAGAFSATHTYVDDNPTATASDAVTISATVNNSRTGSVTATHALTVNNAAPSVSASLNVATISENGSVTLTGSFTDAGVADTHSLVINWGDGSSTVPVTAANGAGTFTATHQYKDDNPTGTASDTYTISLSLRDDDTGVGTATKSLTVNNVAPTLSLSLDTSTVNEGGTVSLTGTVTDVGTLDTKSVTIAWGDGTTTTVTVPQGQTTFTRAHTYRDDNPTGTPSDSVTISATATDDDTGSVTATAALTVNNVAPSNVALQFGALDIYENDTTAVVVNFQDPGVDDTFTATIDWGDGSTPTTTSLAAAEQHTAAITHRYYDDNPTGTPTDQYVISVVITDDDTGVSSGATSYVWRQITELTGEFVAGEPVITVRSAKPVVRYSDGDQSTQYSDPLATPIVVHAYDVRGVDSADGAAWTESLAIDHTEWQYESGAFQWGLPGQLAVTAIGCGVGTTAPEVPVLDPKVTQPFQECIWEVQGIMDVAPGLYTIRVFAVDDDTVIGSYDTTVRVLPEDAAVYYVGPSFAATVSASNGTATVPLRATVRDITSVPAHPLWDQYPGDVTDGSSVAHAHVTFIDSDRYAFLRAGGATEMSAIQGAKLCEADARVAFVGDTTIADAECNWTVVLPASEDAEIYTIGIVVSGWYTARDDAAAIVTVARPLPNFATGGGTLTLTNAAGQYPGDFGSKSNFGFNVKFDSKGRNLKGKANVIVQAGGRMYQIRTQRIETMGVVAKAGIPRTAQFEARARLIDITDPGNPVDLGSNLHFQMRMTDSDSSADTLGWTLWDTSGLVLFSSNWSGTATIEQPLGGGSLQVQGAK